MHSALEAAWRAEERAPFAGWDFAHLDGRMLEEPTPWSYEQLASELLPGSAPTPDQTISDGNGGTPVPVEVTPEPSPASAAADVGPMPAPAPSPAPPTGTPTAPAAPPEPDVQLYTGAIPSAVAGFLNHGPGAVTVGSHTIWATPDADLTQGTLLRSHEMGHIAQARNAGLDYTPGYIAGAILTAITYRTLDIHDLHPMEIDASRRAGLPTTFPNMPPGWS